MPIWNPWHGCTKYSAGCQNCYVYRIDATHGHNSTTVQKTAAFSLPMQRTRGGTLKLQPTGEPVYTCLSSDFFLPEADDWRPDIWAMIRYRSDLQFFIITKRIVRAAACFPPDWGRGYPNVTICCTAENQQTADERLPVLLQLPIAKKEIICEPLLTPIQLQPVSRSAANPASRQGSAAGNGSRPLRHSVGLQMFHSSSNRLERFLKKGDFVIRFLGHCNTHRHKKRCISYSRSIHPPRRRLLESSTYSKKCKKARKTGMCRTVKVKYILNTRRKKVIFSLT